MIYMWHTGMDIEKRLLDSLSFVSIAINMQDSEQWKNSEQQDSHPGLAGSRVHNGKTGYLDIELVGLRKLISKFRILLNFWSLIDERANCSFLYWRKEMLPTWLSMVYGDACKLSSLPTALKMIVSSFCIFYLDGIHNFLLTHFS
ncbi:hypothetical protein ABZP36_024327, partial [Zizania latifolia]